MGFCVCFCLNFEMNFWGRYLGGGVGSLGGVAEM